MDPHYKEFLSLCSVLRLPPSVVMEEDVVLLRDVAAWRTGQAEARREKGGKGPKNG